MTMIGEIYSKMCYKPYQTVFVNEYTQLDIVPYDSIEELRFVKLADPVEGLADYYSRAEKKPQIMTNGGLFNMKTGHNVMSFIEEYKEINYKNGFEGMGTLSGDSACLCYGTDSAYKWRYFMSAYPMLVIDGKANKSYGNAKSLNYKTARTAIGVTDTGNLLILTVDKQGMTFEQMTAIFLQYHAVYAMNLDGGGSTQKMHNGKIVNNPTENRKVDNAFCVYLKKDPLGVYADKNEIADWARSSVEFVTQNKIMQGDNHGNFRPTDPLTRQELAVALCNTIAYNAGHGN